MAGTASIDLRPALATAYLGGIAGVAEFAHARHLPLPPCWFREFTGLPCPTCGGTRCLLALGHLDLTAALRWNPLVALASVALVLWLVLSIIAPLFGWNFMDRLRQRFARFPIRRLAIGALLLNWLYLLWALPR